MMAAFALTGIQWVFLLALGAAGLYVLYKLLPTLIGKAKSKIG